MITAPLSAQMQLNFALITRGSFLYIAVIVIGKDHRDKPHGFGY